METVSPATYESYLRARRRTSNCTKVLFILGAQLLGGGVFLATTGFKSHVGVGVGVTLAGFVMLAIAVSLCIYQYRTLEYPPTSSPSSRSDNASSLFRLYRLPGHSSGGESDFESPPDYSEIASVSSGRMYNELPPHYSEVVKIKEGFSPT